MMAVAFHVRIRYLLSKRFMKESMYGYSFSGYSSLRFISTFAQPYLTAAFGEETPLIISGRMSKFSWFTGLTPAATAPPRNRSRRRWMNCPT